MLPSVHILWDRVYPFISHPCHMAGEALDTRHCLDYRSWSGSWNIEYALEVMTYMEGANFYQFQYHWKGVGSSLST